LIQACIHGGAAAVNTNQTQSKKQRNQHPKKIRKIRGTPYLIIEKGTGDRGQGTGDRGQVNNACPIIY